MANLGIAIAKPDPPPGLEGRELKKWEKQASKMTRKTNLALRENSRRLAVHDPTASRIRFGFVVGMALASLLATGAFLFAIVGSENLAEVIASGAVVVGLLVTAGFINPLHVVERDILFRRWSDMIAHTYLLQAADENLPASQLKGPADDASARFSALATAYAAVANKALESVQVIATPPAEADGEEKDEAESVSITNPGDQTSKKDEEATLQISATGSDDLAYSAEGLPDGLTIETGSGKVSGKPTTAGEQTVRATAKDESRGLEARATFKWTITEN